ncbi:uncharacterized protein JCM15063_005446 [Sporobolomyces koalae]|uniref:uncharacterized protein n=1 Tax=Sporobolomyces koalae TaxID=500713 RepID=UPI00317172D0
MATLTRTTSSSASRVATDHPPPSPLPPPPLHHPRHYSHSTNAVAGPSDISRSPAQSRPPLPHAAHASASNVIDLTGSSPDPSRSPHTRFPHLSFPSTSTSSSSHAIAGPSRPTNPRRVSSTTTTINLSDEDSDLETNVAPRIRYRRNHPNHNSRTSRPTMAIDEGDDDLVIVSERAAINPVPSMYASGAGSHAGPSTLRRNPPRAGRPRASPPPFIVPRDRSIAIGTFGNAPRPPAAPFSRTTGYDESDEDARYAAELAAEETRRFATGGGGAAQSRPGGGWGTFDNDDRFVQGRGPQHHRHQDDDDAVLRMQAQAMREATRGRSSAGFGGYLFHRAGAGNGGVGGSTGTGEGDVGGDALNQLLAMGARGADGEGYLNALFRNGMGGAVFGGVPFLGFPIGLQGLYGAPTGGPAVNPGGWGGAAKVRAANKKYGVRMSHPNPTPKGFSRDIIEPLDPTALSPPSAKKARTTPKGKGKAKAQEDVLIQELEPVCASCIDPLKLGSEDKDGKIWGLTCGHVVCGKCLRFARDRCRAVLEKEKGGWIINVNDRDTDSSTADPTAKALPNTSMNSKRKGKSKSNQEDTEVNPEWTTCPLVCCEAPRNDLLAEKGSSRPYELYA